MNVELPPEIFLVPNGIFGCSSYGSAYLLEGSDGLVLVDPGTSDSFPRILDWFEAHGIDISRLTGVLLTHIHLDHAGAAGHLAEKISNIKIYVHRKGAPYLVDPSDLLESVRKATGERFPDYGTLKPIPEELIVPVEKETIISPNSRDILALPTPGHAPHHLAYYDRATGALFPGDSAGLYLEERLIPSTPPPSFDFEKSLSSLEEMEKLNPKLLLYPHFGPGANPEELLSDYEITLREWVEEIEKLLDRYEREESVVERVLEEKEDWRVSGVTREEIEMNVEGVLRYLSWKRG